MKIALCCIAKDENPYFEEWITHHKKVGFDTIIIYDNQSKMAISRYFTNNNLCTKDVTIINWNDIEFGSQSRAYINCCKEYLDYNYIAFLDVDEFYISTSMNVKQDLKSLNYPDALGIYWRIYGQPKPYLQKRQSIDKYTYYFGDKHIKSIVNPKLVINFPDPHKAQIKANSIYIDELNRKIISPIGEHTSNNIFIKHVFTRSLEEFHGKRRCKYSKKNKEK